jgi:hypothetical protein
MMYVVDIEFYEQVVVLHHLMILRDSLKYSFYLLIVVEQQEQLLAVAFEFEDRIDDEQNHQQYDLDLFIH